MGSRSQLWTLWAVCLALLALQVALVFVAPVREHPWVAAQTAVAGFVLSLLGLSAVVGSFALRETFLLRDVRRRELDPTTPRGLARARRVLLALWILCLGVGALGCLLAYGAAAPRAAWTYQVIAALLLFLHAPRRRLFEAPSQALTQD